MGSPAGEKKAWPCLGSVGHFSPPLHEWAQETRKQSCRVLKPPFLAIKLYYSVCMGSHWPRTVAIERSLMSGCGLSYRSVQDNCKGSHVKF